MTARLFKSCYLPVMRVLQFAVATLFWYATALSASQVLVLPYGGSQACNTNAAGSAPISCYADNGQTFGGIGTFQGYSYAQGGQTLHAKAEVSTTAFGGEAIAYADLVDTLSLLGTSAYGTVRFQYSIDGNLNSTPNNFFNTFAQAGFRVGPLNQGFMQGPILSGNGPVSQNGFLDVAYTNRSLTFDAQLFAEAQCQNNNAQRFPTCLAAADFYNTGLITGLGIFDSAGVYRPNAVVISTSGFQYAPLASAPEPTSAILFALGISIVSLHKLKRRGALTR